MLCPMKLSVFLKSGLKRLEGLLSSPFLHHPQAAKSDLFDRFPHDKAKILRLRQLLLELLPPFAVQIVQFQGSQSPPLPPLEVQDRGKKRMFNNRPIFMALWNIQKF